MGAVTPPTSCSPAPYRVVGVARGEVVVEVPHAGDVLAVDGPPGVPVTCLARGAAPRGSLLAPVVHDGWDRGRVTRGYRREGVAEG